MRELICYKPRSVGDCCTPSVAWESDGSGGPIADMQWFYNACARNIRRPECIVVKGVSGLRDLVRRLVACSDGRRSFVQWAREIEPAELRQVVLLGRVEALEGTAAGAVGEIERVRQIREEGT